MEYEINKGINKSIEFKGLKAQYIGYLAIGLVALLIGFAVLYITGVSLYLCLPMVGGAGFILFTKVFRFSRKYGQYGLLKEIAFRKVPGAVTVKTRKAVRKTKK
ncbi:DUF4133 domain-containing protein [Galbibacter sp. EGI 63066]|uniref:DUF4133 domain-containing protein n=1 Tax=Galbibacter sp. EGI 63066 TaxID=2993559 RepID=UPI0022494C82|nr:DUF4133 domain-containing protein [Galbibacter sp. EGI 63066]MCX2680986.1 DUF4133 domain-containing protein [Galbibacter sp. EGI 63066]